MIALLCHLMDRIHAPQIAEHTRHQDLALDLLYDEIISATTSIHIVTNVGVISNRIEVTASDLLLRREVDQDSHHPEAMEIVDDRLRALMMTMKPSRSNQILLV